MGDELIGYVRRENQISFKVGSGGWPRLSIIIIITIIIRGFLCHCPYDGRPIIAVEAHGLAIVATSVLRAYY